MILGKNITRQKQYQQDCYTREEFYEILSESIDLRVRSFNSGCREEFSDYQIKNDSIDFTIYNIFYPLPLVKEILIKNWGGGWSSDQCSIHLEYFENRWVMRRVMRGEKIDISDKIITKFEIFPEIIRFIEHFDEEKSKKILRSFNLKALL